jgi:hypothetical protein
LDEKEHPGPTVIVQDLDFLHIGNLPQATAGGGTERAYATQQTRVIRYQFHTHAAIEAFLAEEDRIGGHVHVHSFDARIIRPNGQVDHLNAANCKVSMVEEPNRRGRHQRYSFADVDLHPGDQFEVAKVLHMNALFFKQDVCVQERFPVVEKHLVITAWDMPRLDIRTYNGFPPMELEAEGDQVIRRWTFRDLQARASGPYQVALVDEPFYSMYVRVMMTPGMLLGEFRSDNNYQHYAGRKHKHAFVDHMAERIRVIGAAHHTAVVKDIVAFVRDSITMVPEEELDTNEPIGRYFHDRIMSPAKLFHLYRQMFNALEMPFDICFVRDRYNTSPNTDEVRPEDLTDHLLAFKDERTGAYHYLAINTLYNRYLLDEIPYWMMGQKALMVEYDAMKHDPENHALTLPDPRPSDNLLVERFRVEIKEDGLPTCTGRGAVTGAMRQSWDADVAAGELLPFVRPDVRSPHQRHIAVDSVVVEQAVPTKLSYHPTPLPPALTARTDGGMEVWQVDLERMLAVPSFGTSGTVVMPNSLLPYPYVQRFDVIVTFPVDVELVPSPTPVGLTNTFGTLNRTCEQRDARTIHWHLDHALTNVWVDRTMQPIYLELVRPLATSSTFTFEVRKL